MNTMDNPQSDYKSRWGRMLHPSLIGLSLFASFLSAPFYLSYGTIDPDASISRILFQVFTLQWRLILLVAIIFPLLFAILTIRRNSTLLIIDWITRDREKTGPILAGFLVSMFVFMYLAANLFIWAMNASGL